MTVAINKTRRRGDLWHFAGSLVASLGWLGFIFSNSLKSAEESEAQSEAALGLLTWFFGLFGVDDVLREELLRKLAHFAEFAILSLLVSLTIFTLWRLARSGESPSRARPLLWGSLPICFLLALTDEWLQTLSEGRATEVSDVLLDTCGAAAASVCLQVGISLIILVRKNTKKKRNF